ncbi:hypothetical protein YPPY64_1803, partial [Yersinia pestis PY-64]
MLILKRFL